MEIEAQMAADREKAADMANKQAEKEEMRRKHAVQGGAASVGMKSAVRRPAPAAGAKKPGSGVVSSGSVVRRPPTKRVGRGF